MFSCCCFRVNCFRAACAGLPEDSYNDYGRPEGEALQISRTRHSHPSIVRYGAVGAAVIKVNVTVKLFKRETTGWSGDFTRLIASRLLIERRRIGRGARTKVFKAMARGEILSSSR